MDKDFEGWGIKKKEIHYSNKTIPFFNEREVWWCSLGINIGQEQDGKNNDYQRPVLILRKFNKDVLWIMSISSKVKNNPYNFAVKNDRGNQTVILTQLRLVSSRRLIKKMRTISEDEFKKIKEQLRNLI